MSGPVTISLAASGDLERLGSSFAQGAWMGLVVTGWMPAAPLHRNHERFRGPAPPEDSLFVSDRTE